MSRSGRTLALLGGVAVLGCSDTGQSLVTVPLFVSGVDIDGPIAAGDAEVTLERADVAFGPLYLCAGFNAGDLCDVAVVEWLDSATANGLSGQRVEVGQLVGVSGNVRSWMYDHGISSLLTDREPIRLAAAEQLGGVSVALEGRAVIDGTTIPFRADVPILQGTDTEQGVPVVRKSPDEVFDRELSSNEAGLNVRFDPRNWVAGVDFEAVVEDATCGPDVAVACAGSVEQTCDELGAIQGTRDCGASGEFCRAGVGCTDRLIFEDNTQPFRSVRNAITSGERPQFEWLSD